MAKRKKAAAPAPKKPENLMFDGWKWAALIAAIALPAIAFFMKMNGR